LDGEEAMKPEPIFYDTETCGLHGPTVLIQWAEGDGDIHLHSVWTTPLQDTLDLIEMMMAHEGGLVGFNLAFDHFHLCQSYTVLQLLGEEYGYDIYPEDYITEYAELEEAGRDGPCLKPVTAFDIMLHARKTEYQSTMDRKDVRIKKIPTALAHYLVEELNARIKLKDVYFARYADKKRRWQVADIKDDLDEVIPDFKDIILKFAPSSALKALAMDALEIDDVTKFDEVELDKAFRPVETGYAPFATAPTTYQTRKNWVRPDRNNWFGKWPDVISHHIRHWGYNKLARQYATDDVVYTRDLYRYFGSPDMGDTDSLLACMVGAVRWRGYKVDLVRMRKLREKKQRMLDTAQVAYNSPQRCRQYITEVMSDVEKLSIMNDGKVSTKGIVLEELTRWKKEEVCDACYGMGCDKCEDGMIPSDEEHPVAERARNILEARHAQKEIENLDKILRAGRFHASFKVIGTLSGRMAGADGLNPQGIKNEKEYRSCFPLAWDGFETEGGDFKSFEVSIADAVYADERLRAALLRGKKIHAIVGMYFFPGMSYEDICATDGLGGADDKYTRSKQGVFAMLYGGEAYTLSNRVGIPEADADEAYYRFTQDYPDLGKARSKISGMFQALSQPGGIGSKVEWQEPHEYIESMFGFRRYFNLENDIIRALFALAEDPPEAWNAVKLKVVRRDRVQTATGACKSALYAACFAMQGANMRAAGNHVIQSPGSTMTKELQVRLWGLQPSGVQDWHIMPMNIHDEVLAPTLPSLSPKVQNIVAEFIEEYKQFVPLLGIDWKSNITDWSEKK
jgi:hypothetical protein